MPSKTDIAVLKEQSMQNLSDHKEIKESLGKIEAKLDEIKNIMEVK
jgi:hypothetical protein